MNQRGAAEESEETSDKLERTSCIACGRGFQTWSFNFAVGNRSHRGIFMGAWT